MTFDFEGHGAACDAAIHAPTLYQVLSSYRPFRSEDMTHFLSRHLGGLVTLTFDLKSDVR